MGRKRASPAAKAVRKKSPELLKGGIGNDPADKSGRYELSRPSVTDQVRRKLLKGSDDTRAQTAESLVAAAYQHMRMPDEGSRVYGRAFQTLVEPDPNLSFAENAARLAQRQEEFLSMMTPAEADVVRQAFANAIEPEAPPANTARTREEKIKAIARKAVEDANLQETFNLDTGASPTTQPTQPNIFTQGNVRYTDKVVDQPGPEWTKGQTARGMRYVTIAPSKPGDAPRYVREVLPSVVEAEQAAAAKPEPNPSAGRVVMTPRSRRVDAAAQTVDRLDPTDFDALSEETRRAVTAATEIKDQIDEMEEYDPDFLDTDEGKRLARVFTQITDKHPDSIPFIDDASLSQRSMPKDVVQGPEGAQALPKQMRLGYYLGSTVAQKSPHGWETRGDRRTSFNVPADAPNRMGWLQAVTRLIETKGKDGQTVRKRIPRSGDPALEGGMGAVQLPYPTSMIGDSASTKLAREDLDYTPRNSRSSGAAQPDATAEVDVADAFATDAEIEAALGESEYGPVFSEDATAQPVEDRSLLAESWAKPAKGEYLTYGTAEGSPKRVKDDRDYALREGRSAQQKLAEKLFRAASDFGDIESVADNRRSTGSVTPSLAFEGDELAGEAVYEATGGGGRIRTRASGPSPTRELRSDQLLDLDNLVPIWRGLIEDVDNGQVVLRRPTPLEIAGFLVDRADLPDATLANRLEGIVSASMEAQESQPAKGKAKRTSGLYFPSGPGRGKFIQQQIAQTRVAGDTRPLISDEAQRLIDQSQQARAQAAQAGWEASGGTEQGGSWQADTAESQPAEPAAPLQVDPAAVAAFSGRPGQRVQALQQAARAARPQAATGTPVKRLVIAGGRDFSDYEALKSAAQKAIAELAPNNERVIIVSGGARGADALGEKLAQEMGLEVERYPADWSQGKGAGPARNAQMADVADAALLMPGGRGTANMRDQMGKRIKRVFEADKMAAQPQIPAGETPVQQQRLFQPPKKAGGSGQPPTNIASLLAMLTGIGAAAGIGGEAEASELPPLESLAMARQRSSAARIRAAGGANPAPAQNPTPTQTPAPTPTPAPAPQPAAKRTAKRAAKQAVPRQQATPQPPAQTAPAPAQPWFPNDPTMNALRKIAPAAGGVAGYLPSIAAGTAAAAAIPYVVPPVVQAYRSMFNEMGGAPAQQEPERDKLQELFDTMELAPPPDGMQPMPQAPSLNNSTSRILALRKMLG